MIKTRSLGDSTDKKMRCDVMLSQINRIELNCSASVLFKLKSYMIRSSVRKYSNRSANKCEEKKVERKKATKLIKGENFYGILVPKHEHEPFKTMPHSDDSGCGCGCALKITSTKTSKDELMKNILRMRKAS